MARRMRGEGAVFKRKDGRWVGELDLGWVDGRRARRLFYGRTQDEAARRMREAQRKVDDGTLTLGPALTLEQWLRHWLDTVAARKVRPSTLRTYRMYVERHLIPALGRHRLDGAKRLRPSHVRELHASMADAGLAPRSIVQAHRILARALRVAEEEELVTRNAASVVGVPTAPKARTRKFTAGEARAILATIQGRRNGARWGLALAVGMRQGETLGLGWDQLDLAAGTVEVAEGRALQRQPYRHGCDGRCADGVRAMRCPARQGGLVFVDPKSQTSKRVVPVGPMLTEWLRAHRQEQLAARMAAPRWEDRGLVFTQPNGQPIDPRRDWQEWQDILAEAGVPRGRVHDARHATATLLLELGVDVKVVQVILGHSSSVITRDIYQDVDVPLMRDAVGRLDRALWGALPVSLPVTGPGE